MGTAPMRSSRFDRDDNMFMSEFDKVSHAEFGKVSHSEFAKEDSPFYMTDLKKATTFANIPQSKI